MKKRILQLIVGYIIFTFGVSLTVIANVGVSSWDTVYLGMKGHLGGTYGTWSLIIQILLVIINSLILWKRPDYLSIVGVVIFSALIDFWLTIVFPGVLLEGIVIQVLTFILGVVLISFGIAMYIRTKIFNSPSDGLMIATSIRLKISLKVARTLNEITVLVVGFLLGGPVGVGTVVLSLCLGYGIQTCYDFLEKRNL